MLRPSLSLFLLFSSVVLSQWAYYPGYQPVAYTYPVYPTYTYPTYTYPTYTYPTYGYPYARPYVVPYRPYRPGFGGGLLTGYLAGRIVG